MIFAPMDYGEMALANMELGWLSQKVTSEGYRVIDEIRSFDDPYYTKVQSLSDSYYKPLVATLGFNL